MTDRYTFLKTSTNQAGEVVALVADKDVIGESGVRSLQLAFNAHATPITRSGVLTLTEAGLKELKTHIEKSADAMPSSLAALNRALECVQIKKNGLVAKAAQRPAAVFAR